ncbi:MAG: cyclic nucleotide-binding domain-containing protein [Eisenbergiella sp.]
MEKGVMSKRTIIYYFSKEYKIQDEKTLGRLSDIAFIKKVNHRDILLKQGEIPECLLFQIKGIIGGYHVDEKGKCHMELFSGQYKLPISVTCRPKDTSSLTLEALTKGEVIVVPKDAFWELALESEEMMKLKYQHAFERFESSDGAEESADSL